MNFILKENMYKTMLKQNQIINDGKYEYNTIALPFLAELGRQIYDFELKRKK